MKQEFDYDELVTQGCYLNSNYAKDLSDVPVQEADMVNHPSHYCFGGIECIDAIRSCLSDDEFRGYCKGNALKYLWRERHKGGDESLKKAGWYIKRAAGEKTC